MDHFKLKAKAPLNTHSLSEPRKFSGVPKFNGCWPLPSPAFSLPTFAPAPSPPTSTVFPSSPRTGPDAETPPLGRSQRPEAGRPFSPPRPPASGPPTALPRLQGAGETGRPLGPSRWAWGLADGGLCARGKGPSCRDSKARPGKASPRAARRAGRQRRAAACQEAELLPGLGPRAPAWPLLLVAAALGGGACEEDGL